MPEINIAICADTESDQIVKFVTADYFAESDKLSESDKQHILRDGVCGAYIGEDDEIFVVIDGGDDAIATGLY